MVTLIAQNLSEFDLHARAILGLPISKIRTAKAAASSVILAECDVEDPVYPGLEKALALPDVDVRIFGKQSGHRYRRMGVALAIGKTTTEARRQANKAAKMIRVKNR
ncbi:MAG: hypothetical protein JNJ49_10025 [Bdellovibrionaceae bacterium]|nr:hypothetical protein [Pseudobdellovibrionaceae bacterium]